MIKNNKSGITPCQAQTILNAMYEITGDNQVLRKVDGQVVFHNPYNEKIRENCPFSVPIKLVEDYIEQKERKKNDPAKTYEDLYICARAGKIPNKVLKWAAKKWVEKSPVIAAIINGEKRFFEGRAKSSARYNKENYWKIHDHAKKLHSLGYKPYFLTITNDPKPYRHDYIEAWEGFHSNVGRLLKNVCRKYHAYYECVYEAQKSGNPHAHVVLWFSNFFEDDKIVTTKKKTFISSGTLKNYLRKYELCTGFMELRRGENKDPISYLLKYISKATTRDFYAMAKDTNRLGDSDRKDLLSAMLPILAGVRQFSMSQGVLDKEEPQEKTSSSVQNETQTPKAFESASEARAYLKKLCTNFPLSCQSVVRLFNYKQISKGITLSPKDLQKLSQTRKDELYNEGRCLGCKGCIITHFINFINTGSDPWFDIKTDDSKELKSKIVEGDGLLAEIYEDDETPEELAKRKEKAFEEANRGYLEPEQYAIALEKEAIAEQKAKDKAIYADIAQKQSIQGFSMLTNLEKFSVNSRLDSVPKKIVMRKPKGKTKIALSDERFEALKGAKTIYVYASVKVTQFVELFDFEYTQKIIKIGNEKTNEELFAELHIVDGDKVHIDSTKPAIITVQLKPTEEFSNLCFDSAIHFYKNDDLTD